MDAGAGRVNYPRRQFKGKQVVNEQPTQGDSQPVNVGDRPWQAHSEERAVDESVVAAWSEALAQLRSANDQTSAASRPAPLAPGLTLVVSAGPGDDLAGCLDAVAHQSLTPDHYDVLVVVDGPTAAVESALHGLTAAGVTVRVVEAAPGTLRARDAGLAASRRLLTGFLAAGDRIGPDYLDRMLAGADPASVILAAGADAGEAEAALPTTVTGTVVPTALARRASADGASDVRDDVVFLATLLTTYGCEARPVPLAGSAAYHRDPNAGSGADNRAVDQGPDDFDTRVMGPMSVLRSLDALSRGCSPSTLALVRAHIDTEVDRINAYLHAHPDDHGRVVELLDAHGFDYFPYERLNRGRARALAVAYCFAPYNDTSAVVMAKRVRDRQDIVDAVFNVMDGKREKDPSIRRVSGPYVENEIAVDTPTYFSNWASIEAFREVGLERIAEIERVKGPYERVYSRVMWTASHFLAAAYKMRNPATTWTAEFSDPAARDVQGEVRSAPLSESAFLDEVRAEVRRRGLPLLASDNVLDWCEYIAYVFADRVVFTNPNQLEYMLSYAPVPEAAALAREKAVISPHPTLPPAFYSMVEQSYPLDGSLVHLAYFGNFYATRGLGDVLTALAGLEPSIRERIRLHVFTGKATELRKHMDELGIADLVVINPFVRFLAFLNMASKFDCLIVNDAVTADKHARNPYLPSKWSDYAGSGRPVWGLVEAGSPLSTQPLHHASPVGDIAAAQDVLRKLAATADSR